MPTDAQSDARSYLSEEQIGEFKAAFDMFDTDGGGDISTKELGTVMRMLGQNPTAVSVCGRNADGYIDREEFAMIIRSAGENVSDEEIDELLREGDKNNDGKLDFDEWLKLMENVQ
nr:PREDICTED: troponin C, skeletal muscle-like [Lepisosteus oculatus]